MNAYEYKDNHVNSNPLSLPSAPVYGTSVGNPVTFSFDYYYYIVGT